MDIFAFNSETLLSFLLTLMRVSLIVFLMPFYGGESIPAPIKAALCLILSLALWPHLSFPAGAFPAHPLGIVVILLGELILGMTLGMCVHFIFAGIQTGGELLAFQMGFTMVSLADPLSGARVSITAHLLYMVSLLTFLALDGHLHLLRALAESFTLLPPGGLTMRGNLVDNVLSLSGGMFVLAVKIAAPVMAAIFMVELALALMARAAPQMNLLTLGFPIKIAVGFFFIGMLFTVLAVRMEETIIDIGPLFDHLMRLAR